MAPSRRSEGRSARSIRCACCAANCKGFDDLQTCASCPESCTTGCESCSDRCSTYASQGPGDAGAGKDPGNSASACQGPDHGYAGCGLETAIQVGTRAGEAGAS